MLQLPIPIRFCQVSIFLQAQTDNYSHIENMGNLHSQTDRDIAVILHMAPTRQGLLGHLLGPRCHPHQYQIRRIYLPSCQQR